MSKPEMLRLGTRGSALALTQSRWVQERLQRLSSGLRVEIVPIKTTGDAQSQPLEPGSGDMNKRLFVKEIEEALLENKIDLAVHSSKDLPGIIPQGLTLAAFPEREDPRDVLLLSSSAAGLEGLGPGAKVATTSLRRKIQIQKIRPGVEVVPIRGNVDTRLRKLDEGGFQGILLAAAGLARLKIERPCHYFPIQEMVPAPGQGALAVECREGDSEVLNILKGLDDEKTRSEVECERAFLIEMGGNCQMPLGALAEKEGGWIRMTVFWSDPEGKNPVTLAGRAKAEKAAALASDLASRVKQLSVL